MVSHTSKSSRAAEHAFLTGVGTYGEASLCLQQDKNEPERTYAEVYVQLPHVCNA